MNLIIIKNKNEYNLSKFKKFFELLNFISKYESMDSNESYIINYRLKYNSSSNIELNLENFNTVDMDYELYTFLVNELLNKVFIDVRFINKSKFGLANIFIKNTLETKSIYLKDILEYMKTIPSKYLYEHKIEKIFKLYLNAKKVILDDILKLYEVLIQIDYLTAIEVEVEDISLFQIKVK